MVLAGWRGLSGAFAYKVLPLLASMMMALRAEILLPISPPELATAAAGRDLFLLVSLVEVALVVVTLAQATLVFLMEDFFSRTDEYFERLTTLRLTIAVLVVFRIVRFLVSVDFFEEDVFVFAAMAVPFKLNRVTKEKIKRLKNVMQEVLNLFITHWALDIDAGKTTLHA